MLGPRLAALATIVALVALAACAPPPAAPGAEAPESRSAAEELPGVDTGELTRRERDEWWRAVTSAYAPCADQAVTIAACVREARPCAACSPAARLAARKVAQGFAGKDLDAALEARFASPRDVAIGDAPTRGPDGAPLTIVVWSDFECPFCRAAAPFLEEVQERLGARVRLVHKLYPLASHPHADGAARAAVAAQNQGRYWEMERLLFANQAAMEPADLEGYARSIGLELGRFRSDLRADATTARIERDQEQAQALGLRGTPFLLINGRVFDLRHYRLDEDLVSWLELDLELSGAPAAPR
jgi:2-hydroxychromene-2-carboxylate isomerase